MGLTSDRMRTGCALAPPPARARAAEALVWCDAGDWKIKEEKKKLDSAAAELAGEEEVVPQPCGCRKCLLSRFLESASLDTHVESHRGAGGGGRWPSLRVRHLPRTVHKSD